MEFNLALKGLRSMKFQKIMLIDMEHDFAVTKRIFQLKQLWLIGFYLYLLGCMFRRNGEYVCTLT